MNKCDDRRVRQPHGVRVGSTRMLVWLLTATAMLALLTLSNDGGSGALVGVAAQQRPGKADDRPEVDYYAVLQLHDKRESATLAEIKASFRRLSRKHHPDVAASAADRQLYAEINRAYEVLSDKRKRKMYDMRGEEGLVLLEKATAVGAGAAAAHPLAQLFHMHTDDGLHGANATLRATVPLELVFTGGTFTFTVNKQKVCTVCKGRGAAPHSPTTRCRYCGGTGAVVQRHMLAPNMYQDVRAACQQCGGRGYVWQQSCPACRGERVVRAATLLSVEVERGVPEGHPVVFEMEADETPERIPGDLTLLLHTHPHPRFARRDNAVDLDTTLQITLKEALLGVDRQLLHLDGVEQVRVRVPGVIAYGTVVKLRGKGMPRLHVPSERGDLYVTLTFTLPANLTSAQRDAIAQVL